MSDGIDRRAALQHLLAIPAGMMLSQDGVARAAAHAHAAVTPSSSAPVVPGGAYEPREFAADEWHLVRVLADLVIPRDARSGSATDAGVPEFMDFILGEFTGNRGWMKDGLAWMNAESRARFGCAFVSATEAQQQALLQAIAYPKLAAPEVRDGVDFFNKFRDLTATGFFTSKLGYADLGYVGNVPNFDWQGTPDDVIRKLGL